MLNKYEKSHTLGYFHDCEMKSAKQLNFNYRLKKH